MLQKIWVLSVSLGFRKMKIASYRYLSASEERIHCCFAFLSYLIVLGYEAGHLLRGQRTLETKEVTRRGLFLAC
jgi:hypothetical protein